VLRRFVRRHRWLIGAVVLVLVGVAAALIRSAIQTRPIYDLNLRSRPHLPPAPAPKPGEKVLIFAPHEDDETLGCGGCIQQAVRAGAKVKVVLMTNGEYPEIDVVLYEETLRPRPAAFVRLGYMRQQETLRAMRYLGVPSGAVTFLGYPNGYLDRMWSPAHWLPENPVRSVRTRAMRSPYRNSMTPGAIYCGQSLLRDVETVLRRDGPDIVITPHPNDIHVDHWPTYAFVRFALAELATQKEDFAANCRVYTYLVHRDAWPAPRGYHPELELVPPAGLLAARQTDWRALWLTRGQIARKHKAIAFYRTQAGGFDRLLLSFARRDDLFGLLPAHTWPAAPAVPNRLVVTDPTADLIAARRNPDADIGFVSLARQLDRMTVTVTTREDASDDTGYHVSVHSGGASAGERVIAQYNWREIEATGSILRAGVLRRMPPQSLKARINGKRAILEAPWPVPNHASFLLIRAWTTKGSRLIDQTAATGLTIERR